MNKSAFITWLLLLVLTIISALISEVDSKFIVLLIMGLAALKFIGVAFKFMELNKAHAFWKTCLICFLFVYIILVLSIK